MSQGYICFRLSRFYCPPRIRHEVSVIARAFLSFRDFLRYWLDSSRYIALYTFNKIPPSTSIIRSTNSSRGCSGGNGNLGGVHRYTAVKAELPVALFTISFVASNCTRSPTALSSVTTGHFFPFLFLRATMSEHKLLPYV